MSAEIFTKPPEMNYHEKAAETSFVEFRKVVESRRSVRLYDGTPIPESVTRECLRLALLAPNSSNLQPWEFHWVKDPEKKKRLAQYCMAQPAATTAAELIVCVARRHTWKRQNRQMLALFANQPGIPKAAVDYYKKIAPIAYTQGPLGILGPFKWLLLTVVGFFQVIPRGPLGVSGMRLWAEKSVALASENLMLAFRAAGYDSCPMEGFDEKRVKKLLALPRDASVVMVVSAGKRKPGGVYGQRIRFPEKQFVFEV